MTRSSIFPSSLQLREFGLHPALRAIFASLALDIVLPAGKVLERPLVDQLVQGVGAGLHLLGLVLGALHRQADVGHLLADARGRLGDPHLGLGGGVLRLDDLLLGAEGLDLRGAASLGLGELLLLGLELGDLLVERLQLGLDAVLALERDAGEVLVARTAWRACVSSFTLLSSIFDCICRRFFAVTTSAMPFLTFCSDSSCFWSL